MLFISILTVIVGKLSKEFMIKLRLSLVVGDP